MKEKLYVCMECGYEWEYETHSCPKCSCADFAEDKEDE